MKGMMKLLISVVALTASGSAIAGNGHYYIGSAANLDICVQAVANRGFTMAHYGAGFDNDGVFYNFTTACFGSFQSPPPPTPRMKRFDVFVKRDVSLDSCAEDIEWYVEDSRCRKSPDNELLRCTTRRSERGSIADVDCVHRVYQIN